MEEYKPELHNIVSEDDSPLKDTEKNSFNGCKLCDAGYIGDKVCECLKHEIMIRRYKNSNIDYDFASLPIIEEEVTAYLKDDEAQGGKFQISLNAFLETYAEDSAEHLNLGKGIAFAGPVGRGKSLSSQKVLMYLIDKGYTGYWITIKKYLDLIKKSWNDDEAKSTLNHIYDCQFLVIDDVGTEYAKQDSDWALVEIDSLFRHRYFKKLPIIITTNSNLEKLTAKYAQRIVSLFHERLMFVPIVSKDDYREKLAKVPDYVNINKFKKE